MQQKKKTKKKITPVVKPFLRGKPVDGGTFKSAVLFFCAMLLMALANLFLGTMLMWDIAWLNIAFNCLLLLVIYSMFYQTGASKGTAAVNQGEIMYLRREEDREPSARELSACFHPLKGFIIALLGVLPLVICALMLSAVAQRQMTGLGALPSWLNTLQRRTEIGGALSYYGQVRPMGLEDGLRVIVRMMIMPWVNMVGVNNRDGLLILERFSALPMLLPALSYGLGYLQGVNVRSRVHTDIAVGKRKRARKEKKQRQARIQKGPEQLN